MEAEIKCLAKWWADKLRMLPVLDNGDNDLDNTAFRAELSISIVDKVKITEEQINKFQEELEKEIRELIIKSDSWNLNAPRWEER